MVPRRTAQYSLLLNHPPCSSLPPSLPVFPIRWKGEYQVPLFKLENCIEGQVWMKKSTNWSIEVTKIDEQCRAEFCTTDCQFRYARCAYRTHHCEQFIGHFFLSKYNGVGWEIFAPMLRTNNGAILSLQSSLEYYIQLL